MPNRSNIAGAVQLRLALAAACEWHVQPGAEARGLAPCPRDAQACVVDPVRGRRAVCCTAHALALAAEWRQTVPNRRQNVTRIRTAWLPGAPRWLSPPRVIGRPQLRRAA